MNGTPAAGTADLEALAHRLDLVGQELIELAVASRASFAPVVWTDVARAELDRDVARFDDGLRSLVAEITTTATYLRRSAALLAVADAA